MLGTTYQMGQRLHRKLSKPVRIERPVLSVGNVALGGRSKTPFVIEICRGLLAKGYFPVVLSRGYARKKKEEVWLEPDSAWVLGLNAKDVGDEALEIYFSAPGTAVLVGSHRAKNAVNYMLLQMEQKLKNRVVFILDDGLQHWSLERDFDLLLLDPKDYSSWTLPWGSLRESVRSGTERADLVMLRGQDFEKKTHLVAQPEDHGENSWVISTRVRDESYVQMMKEVLPLAEFIQLRDHADREKMLKAFAGSPKSQLILGAKEAVKLLPTGQVAEFFRTGRAVISDLIPNRSFELFFAQCVLELKESQKLWSRIDDALAEWD